MVNRDGSEKEIAHIMHLSTSKINSLLHNVAEAYRTNYVRALPSVICVDEIRYAKILSNYFYVTYFSFLTTTAVFRHI